MFSYGFYNSKNGDRKYNASHLGKIFEGVIQDGVFGAAPKPLDTAFKVEAALETDQQSSPKIIVNPGKAWLMNTWSILDAKTVISLGTVNANKKRTDIVVLEINNNYNSGAFTERTNSLKVVEGRDVSISDSQSLPTLTQIWNSGNTERRIWQYPLAFVTVYGSKVTGTTTLAPNIIKTSNIENRIGISGTDAEKYITWTPLVTGAQMQMELSDYYPDFQPLFEQMLNDDAATFNDWFDAMKGQLTEDAATHLQNELDNKIIYGTEEPTQTLEAGQVYFQIEE